MLDLINNEKKFFFTPLLWTNISLEEREVSKLAIFYYEKTMP